MATGINRDLNTIIQAIRNYIISNKSNADTTPGSVISDLLISVNSQVTYDEEVKLELVRRCASVAGLNSILTDTTFKNACMSVLDLTEAEFDELFTTYLYDRVSDYGILPKSSLKSSVIVSFYRTSTLTQDIFIPTGTQCFATLSTGEQVNFVTVEDAYMYASIASTYYFYDSILLDIWKVDVHAEAVEAGSLGNVGARTIIGFGGITGIGSCTNFYSATGGADEELVSEIIARSSNSFLGRQIGSPIGLQNFVASLNYISDVLIKDDTTVTRSEGLGGKIDIFTLGESIGNIQDEVQSGSQLIRYYSSGGNSIISLYPLYRPVSTLVANSSNISLTLDGVPTAIASMSFTSDTGGYSGSISAHDILQLTLTGIIDTSGAEVTITTYSYNKAPLLTQTNLLIEEDRILAQDVLVRAATKKQLILRFGISILSGRYTFAQVKASVETALTNFIATLLLGDSVGMSDLIACVEAVSGVNRMNSSVPGQVFDICCTYDQWLLSPTAVGDINITSGEYIRFRDQSSTPPGLYIYQL